MTRLLHYFIPPVYLVLGVVVALMMGACGVTWVDAVHEARAARQRVCRAELRALVARNRVVDHFARNVDDCEALRIVVSEER